MMKGFTVWCSSGYGNDGWHSYEGPPEQEFDSTWKTAADANARARYLFIWKNTFGSEPDEIYPYDESEKNGLKTYSIAPADSECWTVGVVPDVAFQYLPNATKRRHTNDDETEPRGYSGGNYHFL
jgi:hypothetical protein